MRYRTTVLQTGITTTGIPVPDEVLESLAVGRKPAVVVTLNGHTYRSTVATMGGKSLISLSAENRAAANVAGGQEVDVDVQLDTQPRVVEVPADLAAALAAVPAADQTFGRLSYSQQRAHVLSVDGAKTAETRQRRIAAVVSKVTP
jgi:hypothetical protein